MLLPFLFLFAEVAEAPPPAPTTRVTVSVDASASPQTSTYATGGNSGGSGETAHASVTLYPWAPLVDDESPRSLQPFLERTSMISLGVGGQYARSIYSPRGGGGTYTQTFVPGSASARWFVLSNVALLGAVGANHLHDERVPDAILLSPLRSTRDVWEPWGSVGVDLRAGDAALSLEWQAVTVDETVVNRTKVAPSFFGARFALGGRIVLDRRFDVSARGELIPDGARGHAGFGFYPTKDLGLLLDGGVARGQIYWDTTADYTAIFGGPTVSYWIGSRVNLSASYSPTSVRSSEVTQWKHAIAFGFAGRIP